MSTINTHLHDKDKASEIQAVTGSNNDVWMTPLRTLQAIQSNSIDSVSWGEIDGNISNQTDLQNQFTTLENTLNQTITQLSGSVEGDFEDVRNEIQTEITNLSASVHTTINDTELSLQNQISQLSGSVATTIDNVETTINNRIDSEVTTLNNRVDNEVNSLNTTITQGDNQLDNRITNVSGSISSDLQLLSGSVYTEQQTQNSRLNSLEVESGSIRQDFTTASGSFDSRIEVLEGQPVGEWGQISGSLYDQTDLSGSIDNLQTQIDNITVGSTEWGDIGGTLTNQTDLSGSLAGLQSGIDDLEITKLDITTYNQDSGSFDSRINSKVDQTDFDNYSGSVANDLDSKLDVSVYQVDSGSFDSRIQSKAEQTDLDNLSGSVDTHVSDGTIHYPQSSISITESQISNLDKYTQAQVDGLLDDKLDITVYNQDSGSFDTRIDSKVDQTEFDNVSGSISSELDTKADQSSLDAKLDTSVYEIDSGSFDNRIDQNVTDIQSKAEQVDLTNLSGSVYNHVQDTTIHFTQGEISITESQISDLDKYSQAQVNTLLDDKLDTTVYTQDSGSFDSRIDSKVDQTDFNNYSGSVSNDLDSKVDQTEFDNVSGSISSELDTKSDQIDLTNLSGSVYNHIQNPDIHFLQSEISITESQISDLDKYSQAQVNGLLDDKLDVTTYNLDSGSFDSRIKDKVGQSEFDSVSGSLDTRVGNNSTEITTVSGSVYNHVGDSTIHFTQGQITITESQISDLDKYTQSEVNGLLSDKTDNTDFNNLSGSVNTHVNDGTVHYPQSSISITESQISDLDKYSQSQVNTLLNDKLDVSVYTTDSGSFDSRIDSKVDQTQFDNVSGSLDTRVSQNESDITTKVTGDGTGKITVSSTQPTSPTVGDIWVDIS